MKRSNAKTQTELQLGLSLNTGVKAYNKQQRIEKIEINLKM